MVKKVNNIISPCVWKNSSKLMRNARLLLLALISNLLPMPQEWKSSMTSLYTCLTFDSVILTELSTTKPKNRSRVKYNGKIENSRKVLTIIYPA